MGQPKQLAPKKTDITFLLDRSGSMSSIRDDVVGGFNSFVEEQKKVEGEAALTVSQFDSDSFDTLCHAVDIQEAPELNRNNFVPRGATPLLDAMGKAVAAAEERANDKTNMVFVVFTDGHENDSKEFTRDKIFKIVKDKQEREGWQFIFMGANQDAIAEAGKIGIGPRTAVAYAAHAMGVKSIVGSTSRKLAAYRLSGDASGLAYSEQERDEAMTGTK